MLRSRKVAATALGIWLYTQYVEYQLNEAIRTPPVPSIRKADR